MAKSRLSLLSRLSALIPKRLRRRAAIVPLVRMSGVIGFSTPLKPGLTLAGVSRALDRAFSMKRAKAVALLVNSPGGSPVQSNLIFQRVRQLSDEKKIPVIAYIEDVGASGGYMIACAGDEIVCDPSSIVGSIGVVGATFGLQKAIKKLGIERRVYTSGERKVMLDPFLPEKPDDVKRLRAIQRRIHNTFIDLVKSRRGEKLTGPESALFSGEYWDGATAVELGLADRLGDTRSDLRRRFGKDVVTPLIADRGWLGRKLGVSGRMSPAQALGEDFISALEARAIWGRYGL